MGGCVDVGHQQQQVQGVTAPLALKTRFLSLPWSYKRECLGLLKSLIETISETPRDQVTESARWWRLHRKERSFSSIIFVFWTLLVLNLILRPVCYWPGRALICWCYESLPESYAILFGMMLNQVWNKQRPKARIIDGNLNLSFFDKVFTTLRMNAAAAG